MGYFSYKFLVNSGGVMSPFSAHPAILLLPISRDRERGMGGGFGNGLLLKLILFMGRRHVALLCPSHNPPFAGEQAEKKDRGEPAMRTGEEWRRR